MTMLLSIVLCTVVAKKMRYLTRANKGAVVHCFSLPFSVHLTSLDLSRGAEQEQRRGRVEQARRREERRERGRG